MRTKKIYYLETTQNTYMRRHDLYNSGARWDAKAKHWWSQTPGPIRKAAEMLGSDAKPVVAHVQALPKVGKTFRGGRPRAARNGKGRHRDVTAVITHELVSESAAVPLAATGTPFVRGARGDDRRKAADRRNESTRPEAVLVVPMVQAPELVEAKD